MYRIAKNSQLRRQKPIVLMCGYYAVIGSFFTLASCSYVGTMLIGIAISPPETLSKGMNAELFWTALLLLINASRLVLCIGLLRNRRWAYRWIMLLESCMVINLSYELFLSQSPMTLFPIFTFITGALGVLILGYLAQAHIQRQIKGLA